MKVEILNTDNRCQWDSLLSGRDDSSIFHLSNWGKVLSSTYRYRPVNFVARCDGQVTGLIPCMEVDSMLTGRRGVSLPFTDYCEPMVRDQETFNAIFDGIVDYGKKSGWKSVELRGGRKYLPYAPESAAYLGHTLDLSDNLQQTIGRFRKSTSRNIQKAVSSGVEATICDSVQSVKEFYRLHCMTRKRHGLPPQPFRFFSNIHEYIISRNLGLVVLASHESRVVGGAVYFHFGETAIYKYGASDDRARHLKVNNLVMWEAIKWYSQNGYTRFCFGRTGRGDAGLIQFKNGWGPVEEPIRYYTYNLSDNTFVNDCPDKSERYRGFCRKLPVPLLRVAGSLLYRHMG
jgi:hypothetical protein